jgi:hypothetical protein
MMTLPARGGAWSCLGDTQSPWAGAWVRDVRTTDARSRSLTEELPFSMSRRFIIAAAALCVLPACDFDSQLAPRVTVPIVIDSAGIQDLRTDLGYEITLIRCRAAIADVEFTTAGLQHASLAGRVGDWLIPTAYAHPGHYAGGEVVGEMPGRFVLDWRADGESIGEATMLEALYDGVNFRFIRAAVEDGLATDDPMLGHTFQIEGNAALEGQSWTFSLLLDEDGDRELVGAELDVEVDSAFADSITLTMHTIDPTEGDTIFDGVDFANLDADGDGHIVFEPGSDAYNVMRRNLQVHDHYAGGVR